MELEQLIEKVKQQDQQAFEELYNRYYSAGFSLTLQFVKNEEDALDIMQDAFITVYSKLDSLESAEKFKSWYMQIVANKCRDFLKKQKPLSFTDANAYDEEGALQFDIEETDRDFIPEEAVDYSETVRIVDEMIAELPEEQRLCILLYFAHDMTIPEIAKALQVSEATVKSRLKYGKDKIRTKTDAYEKKTGVKLYSISGLLLIPFIRWMLSQKPASTPSNPGSAFANIMESISNVGSQMAGATTGAAATAATAATNAATAAGAAAKAGGTFASLTAAQKIIGGVVAGAILLGSTAAIGVKVITDGKHKDDDKPSTRQEETLPPRTQIHIADCIIVEYSGSNGHASASVTVDFVLLDALIGQEKLQAFMDDIGASEAPSMASLLAFTISGGEMLSNGDQIAVNITPSELLQSTGKSLEDIANYFNIDFDTTIALTVTDLNEYQEIDVLAAVKDHIIFEGPDGNAYAYFNFPDGYQHAVTEQILLAFEGAEMTVIVDGEEIGIVDLSLIAPNPIVDGDNDLEIIIEENGPLSNGEMLTFELGDYNLDEILEVLNPLGYTIEVLDYAIEVTGL